VRGTPGHYLASALILGAGTADVCSREEIFGPVASVIRAADYDQAVALSNDTQFGLAAGIVTRSLAREFYTTVKTSYIAAGPA
jgi:alpha-ketoglutaric semialdehyde dehydrogenase